MDRKSRTKLQSSRGFFQRAGGRLGWVALWTALAMSATATTQPALNNVVVTVNRGTVTLQGSIAYPGRSSFNLAVYWGDVTWANTSLPAGTTDFSLMHSYLYPLPTAANSWTFRLSLTLTANDGVNNTGFLSALYGDLLARPIDAGSEATFLSELSQGMSRATVGTQILASTEYCSELVITWLQLFLHRSPSPGEQGPFVNALQAGTSDEAIMASIIGSGEYFSTRANNSNSGFLDAVYYDLCNRKVDNASLNSWLSLLNAGTITRAGVAQAILTSTEYRSDLVNAWYQRFLHRAADPLSLNSFLSALASGTTDEQLIDALLASSEYFNLRSGGTAVAFAPANLANFRPSLGGFSFNQGTVHLTAYGAPGLSYTVQASTNLKDWINLTTVATDGQGNASFSEVPPASSVRVYRLLSQ